LYAKEPVITAYSPNVFLKQPAHLIIKNKILNSGNPVPVSGVLVYTCRWKQVIFKK